MERKTPPVLSNLDPILDDEGFYGVKLAIEDNLTTSITDIKNLEIINRDKNQAGFRQFYSST